MLLKVSVGGTWTPYKAPGISTSHSWREVFCQCSQISFQKTSALSFTHIHLTASRTFLLSGVLWRLQLSISKMKLNFYLVLTPTCSTPTACCLMTGPTTLPTAQARLDFSPKHSLHHMSSTSKCFIILFPSFMLNCLLRAATLCLDWCYLTQRPLHSTTRVQSS